MEYDGQISLLLPESEQIEKQITGQIKLDDVLLEWERMKKDSEQKRMETVRQRVLQQTGAMFTEFEAQMRDGLLEKLESEKTADEPQDDLEIVEEVEEPEEPTETAEPEEIEEPGEIEEPEEIIELEETAETEEVVEIAKSEETEEPEELEELEEPAEVTETEEEELPEEEIAEPEQTLETEEPTEVADTEEVAESEEIEETETTEQSEQSEQSEQLEAAQPAKLRAFSAEENELFGTYAQSETAKAQIIHAIDTISMASYTGNVIITGDEGMDTLTLAKNLVKEVQNTDSNFSGKIAKISGASLNKKDLGQTLDKLEGGALIVQKAAGMNAETAEKLHKILEQEERGIIILLIDTKKYMNRFMEENAALNNSFTIRMDVEALDNDTLVEFCKKYAREQEYSIDNMAVLALHTRISDRQTSDHAVTISEVRTMMDEAIRHANRKNMGHFFDILLARRYDEEDMIILREKDFV